MKPQDFLSKEEQEKVLSAIKAAETNTSGEIRVHIDSVCKTDPYVRAIKVFRLLGMEHTKERNAVLIYVACESKVFAIVGDKGINDVVGADFWDEVSALMHNHFAAGEFASGLSEAIGLAGEKLKSFFPYRSDDINEQSDDISYDESFKDKV